MENSTTQYLTKFLNIDLDEKFATIENLNCFPWVGKEFLNSNNKILIVAESSYGSTENQINEHLRNKNYTREIIAEDNDTKYYNNMFKALLGNNSFSKDSFWNNVSFYNLVQRPMNYIDNNREQPKFEDYQKGWNTFYRVIEILEPKIILLFSLNAVIHFQDDASKRWNKSSFKKLSKVGKNYPRIIEIDNNKNHKKKMIFVKHPSRYFSPPKWNLFLKENILEEIKYLENNCLIS